MTTILAFIPRQVRYVLPVAALPTRSRYRTFVGDRGVPAYTSSLG